MFGGMDSETLRELARVADEDRDRAKASLEALKAGIRQAHAEGKTLAAIAADVGRNTARVGQICDPEYPKAAKKKPHRTTEWRRRNKAKETAGQSPP